MFEDGAAVRATFEAFVKRVRPGGLVLLCRDDAGAAALAPPAREGAAGDDVAVVTYGLREGSDWRAIALTPNNEGGTDFVVVHKDRPFGRVNLPIPGQHNVLNALAAFVTASVLAAADETGATPAEAAHGDERPLVRGAFAAAMALTNFRGVRRRFETVGKARGVTVIDDYAHHPTEVRAALQGARQRHDGAKVWAVFQPHTFSRLDALMDDFVTAFSGAHRVLVTDVFAAREERPADPDAGAEGLAANVIGPVAEYVGSLEQAEERVADLLALELSLLEDGDRANVVVLTLGAGDVTGLGPRLLDRLRGDCDVDDDE